MTIRADGVASRTFARAITTQGITVSLGGDRKVDVLRVADCSGEILLCGVEINENGSAGKATKKPTVLVPQETNWDTVLKACGKYRGLKLSKDILYAIEGATIDAYNIDNIETEPQNVAKCTGDIIKFAYPCQILSIILNDAVQIKDPKYVHMQNSAIVSVIKSKSGDKKVSSDATLPLKTVTDVYDSAGKCLFEVATQKKDVERSGDSVILKRHGEITIPIVNLSSSMIYTVVLTVGRIGGNGKISAEFVNKRGIGQGTSTFIAYERVQNGVMRLESGMGQAGEYSLHIFRPETSVGNVRIDSVKIPDGKQHNFVNPIMLPDVNYNTGTPAPKGSVRKVSDYSLSVVNEDIKDIFKYYAVLNSPTYKNVYNDVSGSVNLIGAGAKQWFNKISPLFPKITKQVCDFTVCSIGSIVPASVVWLEEFDHNVRFEDVELLKPVNIICTPSLSNLYMLRRWFPDKNVKVQHRPWPILGPKAKSKQDYYVYLEKDSNVTQLLLQLWKKEYGKLYVVGARCKIPEHINYISEYEPYNELYKVIAGAYGIIDISANSHYISGILELACVLGLQVITNNHKYLSYTPYIIRNSRGNNEYYVLKKDIISTIERCIHGSFVPKPTHYNTKMAMAKMLEIKC